MSARLVVIDQTQPWGGERESTVERVTQTVLSSTADFYVLIQAARSNRDVLRIRALVGECVLALQAAEDAALNRADALCVQPDYLKGA